MAFSVVVKNRHQIAAETEDALTESGHQVALDPEGTGVTRFCQRTGYRVLSVGFDAEGRAQTWVFAKGA